MYLPSLRGLMGDWAYYVTLMPLSEVAARVRPAQEIHKSDTLCELIQRSVSARTGDIAKYLNRQPQHLFNSIIAGIYEGDPQWFEMEIPTSKNYRNVSFSGGLEHCLGSLHLTGTEKIFALDGQHRVAGIKEALNTNPSLGDEHLSVIFVAHSNEKPGLERSRRLFATLNRYAKPVSRLEIIALDEDDPVAIATRQLLRDHPLLSKKGVIATSKGKQMPSTNVEALTTAVALYEGLLSYLLQVREISKKDQAEFLAVRPDETALRKLVTDVIALVNATITHIPSIATYKQKGDHAQRALEFRNERGGDLLFRPVGFLAYASAVGRAVSRGMEVRQVASRIGSSCLSISEHPWRGLIFDPSTGTMNASSAKGALEVYATIVLLNAGMENAVTKKERDDARVFVTKALSSDTGVLLNRYKNLLK